MYIYIYFVHVFAFPNVKLVSFRGLFFANLKEFLKII